MAKVTPQMQILLYLQDLQDLQCVLLDLRNV